MATTLATKRPEVLSSPRYCRRCGFAKLFRGAASRFRLVNAVLAMVTSLSLGAPSAVAQTSRFTTAVSIDESFTNNVNLDSRENAINDFITQITPSVSFREAGGRLKLNGFVSLPILKYARTSENDTIVPQVNVSATAEVIERVFFVDTAINVQQQFNSPFGARPVTLDSSTVNRFTAQSYNVSPYIRGGTGDYSYELRDNNIWTKSSGTLGSIPTSSYSNEIVGTILRRPTPFGWTIDYDRSDVKFPDQGPLITQLVRARGVWQVDPQVEISAGGGYEDNRYTLASYKDTIYSVGVRWRPTERTAVNANVEHRFFGASYNFEFDHRTPLSVWSLHASRNTTTYPQQLASLPAGSSIVALLNQLLLASIPDPVQRQAYIDQLISSGSVPQLTSGAVNLFTQQVLLQEQASASVGLIGARNTVYFTVFRTHSEPVAGAGIPLEGLVSSIGNNTQTGGSVVWTQKLTPSLTLTASGDVLRTVANAPDTGKTNQGALRSSLATPISANTSVYASTRYQRLRSDVAAFDIPASYSEFGISIGMNHTFR
jgi:uncharacterized protein (PEP-CTERM system associated)